MNVFIGHKPDRQHIQALLACKSQNESLVALFEAKLEEVKLALLQADDMSRVYKLQGQASVLKDFLDAVEKSSEVLERL